MLQEYLSATFYGNTISLEILRRFAEAGLEMAFPTQTLYTVSQDPPPAQ
jgi:small-conductance mechanosensitive channel